MILALPSYQLNGLFSYYWNLNIGKELEPKYSLGFGMLFKSRGEILMQEGPYLVVIIWSLDLQLLMHSVNITTKVACGNPTHGEVYLIQIYVIQFISDLRQVGAFSWYNGFLYH